MHLGREKDGDLLERDRTSGFSPVIHADLWMLKLKWDLNVEVTSRFCFKQRGGLGNCIRLDVGVVVFRGFWLSLR